MKKTKLEKIGHAIGYISALVVCVLFASVIAAFLFGVLLKIWEVIF